MVLHIHFLRGLAHYFAVFCMQVCERWRFHFERYSYPLEDILQHLSSNIDSMHFLALPDRLVTGVRGIFTWGLTLLTHPVWQPHIHHQQQETRTLKLELKQEPPEP